jgi:hypothetical protein
MNLRIRKDLDWMEANEFFYGVAHVLELADWEVLCDMIQEIRSDQTKQPEDLVRKVFEFLGTRDGGFQA